MASLTPSDPRQLLEDAAKTTSAFSEVRTDVFPDEIARGDLPQWAIDPRDEEGDHETDGSGGRLYTGIPLQYIVYLAVESGSDPSDRSDARDALRSLRNDYLTQLFDTFDDNDVEGYAEKTARIGREVRQAETIMRVDAISITVLQVQDYQ